MTGILISYKIQVGGAKLHTTTIFWQDFDRFSRCEELSVKSKQTTTTTTTTKNPGNSVCPKTLRKQKLPINTIK